MSKKEDKEQKSPELRNAEEGVLDAAYTSRTKKGWFVKIKPSLGIDKIKFSFVETEPYKDPKTGQMKSRYLDGFDLFIGIRIMRAWCLRMLSGKFFEDLEAEKAKGLTTPNRYKVQTGDNGSVHLGFMASSKEGFVAINAKDATHSYVTIPISVSVLENFACDFMEVTRARFSELLDITVKASSAYWTKQQIQESIANAMPDEDELMEGELFADEPEGETVKQDEPILSENTQQAAPANETKKNTSPKDIVEFKAHWAVEKGSVKEKRGKNGDVLVLRLVVPTISESDPGILNTDSKFQVCDCIFYENNIQKLNSPELNEKLVKIERGKQISFPVLKYKVGDIRNGYRQLIFWAS